MQTRTPEAVAAELTRVVDAAAERLRTLDAAVAAERPAPGKWSVQETIGHLIDSATNNHHRFVRAQAAEGVFVFPKYEQDFWVAAQAYGAAPWLELVALWQHYNRHLARVMRAIPADKLSVECRIGSYEPATLGFLVEDYLVHLRHHLAQIDALLQR